MSRVLAVDWGEKRVGVAVSDPMGWIARPLPTLDGRNRKSLMERLLKIIRQEKVETVVIGHPLHMDGRKGSSAQAAQNLARSLQAALDGVEIVLYDERLTSVEAQAILSGRGERTRGKKERVDQVAAAVLLQTYLNGRDS
ncbi:MAG: Holliday junction resolvase RuvX [Acidobacteriota bacterium]|jgi:putative holliday junction resolvase